MAQTGRSLLIICTALLNISLCIYGEPKPEAHTKLGKIIGSVMKTRLGKDIYAFRGIRYAKPPIGNLRFLLPVPVDSWHNAYDATQDGPACIQLYGNGNEDCLILNVFTTKLPSRDNPTTRAVIVFIHGGELRFGSSRSSELGPQYLLDKDIVLVTLNYRLGPLGFISTGDKHAPGNLGFKDQNLALRFVRDHIAAFGGDPNSVTLAGQSGGSRSVYLHLMSPMSRGLFHRAIAHSGTAQLLEPYPKHQKNFAIELGKLLKCNTKSMEKMFTCLRTVPAEKFANIQQKIWDRRSKPALMWAPVIEPTIPGVERFLTDQPDNLIKSGNFNQIPLITGVVRDEMGYEIIKAIEAVKKGDNSIFNSLNKKWNRIFPISFIHQRDTTKSKSVSRELKRFYFNNQPISLKNTEGWAHILADAITIFPVRRTAILMAGVSKQPIYFFLFNYEGPYSFHHWSNGKTYGVSHTDDMFYIFYHKGFPMIKTTDKENEMLERLTTIWTNFAKTSKPIDNNNALFKGVTWKTLDPKAVDYLEIGTTLNMKENFFADRMQFWNKLYPV